MRKTKGIITLAPQNALHQSVVGIVLMALIPVLSVVYMGTLTWFGPEQVSGEYRILAFFSVSVLAATGLLILLKFPRNILRLRRYVVEVAAGTLPDRVDLLDTRSSDDLKFIENGLNAIIHAMREQLERAEKQQRVERELRETIEHQHECIVHAERHRAMVQSLGAACHHLGQPVSIVGMRLHLMKKIEHVPEEEIVQIEECEKAIQQIMEVLEKLRTVSTFRTEPYIHKPGDEDDGVEILAI